MSDVTHCLVFNSKRQTSFPLESLYQTSFLVYKVAIYLKSSRIIRTSRIIIVQLLLLSYRTEFSVGGVIYIFKFNQSYYTMELHFQKFV